MKWRSLIRIIISLLCGHVKKKNYIFKLCKLISMRNTHFSFTCTLSFFFFSFFIDLKFRDDFNDTLGESPFTLRLLSKLIKKKKNVEIIIFRWNKYHKIYKLFSKNYFTLKYTNQKKNLLYCQVMWCMFSVCVYSFQSPFLREGKTISTP